MAPTVQSFVNTFSMNLEEPVVTHLKSVYACLSMSCISASVGSVLALTNHPLQFLTTGFMPFLLSLGSLIGLLMTPHDPVNRKGQQTRLALLLTFCFCSGISLGPLLDLVIQINPSIIVTALIGTAVLFASLSASALYARRGSYLFLGGLLGSVLSTMVLLSIGNLFFGSMIIHQLNLWVGFVVMSAFVLYDTQLIIEKRRMGETDYIGHSMDLFIDLIGIFRRLLIILTQKEEQNQRKRKD
ncbi:bax inhibitor 1 [Ischnura elegans]|uniref:bax inhibitor 1 n=1 Tax=Ischnura elegans TaxID=197161 RepID=UPI001ED8A416|nr:bax inhibitor 1 [Ischnura elegans]